jgi:hypothetical protein
MLPLIHRIFTSQYENSRICLPPPSEHNFDLKSNCLDTACSHPSGHFPEKHHAIQPIYEWLPRNGSHRICKPLELRQSIPFRRTRGDMEFELFTPIISQLSLRSRNSVAAISVCMACSLRLGRSRLNGSQFSFLSTPIGRDGRGAFGNLGCQLRDL